MLVELYTEQVAGYYDPDSAKLFGVEGADPLQLKVVVAHELVHALQGQYLPLDSILRDLRSNDRLGAAQAVLEGQATLVSIDMMVPPGSTRSPEFWEQYREQVSAQQSAMPVFARAPLVLRRALLFPYIDGAQFVGWWRTTHPPDSMPWGPHMPVSTEQVLHPDRYQRGMRRWNPVHVGSRTDLRRPARRAGGARARGGAGRRVSGVGGAARLGWRPLPAL